MHVMFNSFVILKQYNGTQNPWGANFQMTLTEAVKKANQEYTQGICFREHLIQPNFLRYYINGTKYIYMKIEIFLDTTKIL